MIRIFRYLDIPVPAGMSLPMMTFSLRPMSGSILPLIDASVSTRVVSWKDAAERKLSVWSDALVMPNRIGLKVASSRPFARASSFVSSNLNTSMVSPGSMLVSPGFSTLTLRIICLTTTSICLSLISTPCER